GRWWPCSHCCLEGCLHTERFGKKPILGEAHSKIGIFQIWVFVEFRDLAAKAPFSRQASTVERGRGRTLHRHGADETWLSSRAQRGICLSSTKSSTRFAGTRSSLRSSG